MKAHLCEELTSCFLLENYCKGEKAELSRSQNMLCFYCEQHVNISETVSEEYAALFDSSWIRSFANKSMWEPCQLINSQKGINQPHHSIFNKSWARQHLGCVLTLLSLKCALQTVTWIDCYILGLGKTLSALRMPHTLSYQHFMFLQTFLHHVLTTHNVTLQQVINGIVVIRA